MPNSFDRGDVAVPPVPGGIWPQIASALILHGIFNPSVLQQLRCGTDGTDGTDFRTYERSKFIHPALLRTPSCRKNPFHLFHLSPTRKLSKPLSGLL